MGTYLQKRKNTGCSTKKCRILCMCTKKKLICISFALWRTWVKYLLFNLYCQAIKFFPSLIIFLDFSFVSSRFETGKIINIYKVLTFLFPPPNPVRLTHLLYPWYTRYHFYPKFNFFGKLENFCAAVDSILWSLDFETNASTTITCGLWLSSELFFQLWFFDL